MAISEAANNVLGALGGVILAVCLTPQLLRMYQTRSAVDLSYVFLNLFAVGLILTATYLIVEGALVGYIGIFVELLCVLAMIVAKYYLDNFGKNARGKGQLTAASAARLDLSKFLAGAGGAAFPLMAADKKHTATHLLLDCQLAPTAGGGEADVDDAEAGEAGCGVKPRSASLRDLVEMLQLCLDAAGLRTQRPAFQTFPSFRRADKDENKDEDGVAAGAEGAEANNVGPSVCYVHCEDGYVTAIWNARSSTLAVDFLGASQRAIRDMSDAALAFCRDLEAAHPGTKIAASTVARLPI